MSRRIGLGLAAIGCSLLALSACSADKHAKEGAAQAAPVDPNAAIPAVARELPHYTPTGELILPKNFETWVYVGSPLTPDALNGGKANFPEYHNVYIEPVSYRIYQHTGTFPEGTIMFKELQRTKEKQFPDGSRTEPSGRGFFPGKLNGADVTVKDSKRFAETAGWGYFNFNHSEPKAPTGKLRAKAECAFCHIANAKKDSVWTQFYPRLDR